MSQRSDAALVALRQIQRKTESAAKFLAQTAGLTPSQLVVLQILEEHGEISAGKMVELTQLKHATITSLVDKLVARQLVSRRRCDTDRRRVWLNILPDGRHALAKAPDLLHETFAERFNALPDWQQSMLVAALQHVVVLVDAKAIDAAPMLHIGALDDNPDLGPLTS